jgi:hypothetical protein
MNKSYAIQLLGGTASKAARTIGRTPQAVIQWPDPLTERIQETVEFHFNRLPPSQKRKNKAKAEALLRGQE